MNKFKSYNHKQDQLIVVNFEEQIQPNTFEYTLHTLINDHLDLSAFYGDYKNADCGRPAYDPAILLRILLFAYSKGITSSREIQYQCEKNITFKALSCDTVPHWTTIAGFVRSHHRAIQILFEEVLMVCHEEDLLGNELLAIDGCKLPSNAAKEWSGTLKEREEKRKKIRRHIRSCVKEHQKIDRRRRGEKEHAKRIEQRKQTLEKAQDKLDSFLRDAKPRMGKGRLKKEVKSNITDNESAKMKTNNGTIQGFTGIGTADNKKQVIVDAQVFGSSAESHTYQSIVKAIDERFRRLNISKGLAEEQIIITSDTGFSSEENNQFIRDEHINAYSPDGQFRQRDPRFKKQKAKYGKRHQDEVKGVKQVIPSEAFRLNKKKKTCVCPAGEAMWLHHESTDKNGTHTLYFEGRLSKCRSCPLKERCMRNPESPNDRKGHGRQVSFITNTGRNKPATRWMMKRVDSQKGKQIYGQRMAVIEPVFANIQNKGLKRFSLRSKAKVQTQWLLFCLIHNIEKIKNYGRTLGIKRFISAY